jgi:hypothetical protein
MARPAKIITFFFTVLETAKRLGVSKHAAIVLSDMTERSEKLFYRVLGVWSASTESREWGETPQQVNR